MEPTVHLHLHLDVALSRGTVTGQVGAEGGAPRPFTGWIGLTAAIDDLLVGASREDADDARR